MQEDRTSAGGGSAAGSSDSGQPPQTQQQQAGPQQQLSQKQQVEQQQLASSFDELAAQRTSTTSPMPIQLERVRVDSVSAASGRSRNGSHHSSMPDLIRLDSEPICESPLAGAAATAMMAAAGFPGGGPRASPNNSFSNGQEGWVTFKESIPTSGGGGGLAGVLSSVQALALQQQQQKQQALQPVGSPQVHSGHQSSGGTPSAAQGVGTPMSSASGSAMQQGLGSSDALSAAANGQTPFASFAAMANIPASEFQGPGGAALLPTGPLTPDGSSPLMSGTSQHPQQQQQQQPGGAVVTGIRPGQQQGQGVPGGAALPTTGLQGYHQPPQAPHAPPLSIPSQPMSSLAGTVLGSAPTGTSTATLSPVTPALPLPPGIPGIAGAVSSGAPLSGASQVPLSAGSVQGVGRVNHQHHGSSFSSQSSGGTGSSAQHPPISPPTGSMSAGGVQLGHPGVVSQSQGPGVTGLHSHHPTAPQLAIQTGFSSAQIPLPNGPQTMSFTAKSGQPGGMWAGSSAGAGSAGAGSQAPISSTASSLSQGKLRAAGVAAGHTGSGAHTHTASAAAAANGAKPEPFADLSPFRVGSPIAHSTSCDKLGANSFSSTSLSGAPLTHGGVLGTSGGRASLGNGSPAQYAPHHNKSTSCSSTTETHGFDSALNTHSGLPSPKQGVTATTGITPSSGRSSIGDASGNEPGQGVTSGNAAAAGSKQAGGQQGTGAQKEKGAPPSSTAWLQWGADGVQQQVVTLSFPQSGRLSQGPGVAHGGFLMPSLPGGAAGAGAGPGALQGPVTGYGPAGYASQGQYAMGGLQGPPLPPGSAQGQVGGWLPGPGGPGGMSAQGPGSMYLPSYAAASPWAAGAAAAAAGAVLQAGQQGAGYPGGPGPPGGLMYVPQTTGGMHMNGGVLHPQGALAGALSSQGGGDGAGGESQGLQSPGNSTSDAMLQALNLPASARWRIDPNDLQYGHPRVRLGVGSYGEVFKVGGGWQGWRGLWRRTGSNDCLWQAEVHRSGWGRKPSHCSCLLSGLESPGCDAHMLRCGTCALTL
jgi:hypothetical protein